MDQSIQQQRYATIETGDVRDLLPSEQDLRRAVLEHLSSGRQRPPSARVKKLAAEAAAVLRQTARPRCAADLFPIGISGDGRVTVDGRAAPLPARLQALLKRCDRVAVFILTLGAAVDRLLEDARRRSTAYGAVTDAVAGIAAETMASGVTRAAARSCAPGEAVTARYSPGYCDWPVHGQRWLFGLFADAPAGVCLTSDCLMVPRKSVSGLLAVGPVQHVARYGVLCRTCLWTGCRHRRARCTQRDPATPLDPTLKPESTHT